MTNLLASGHQSLNIIRRDLEDLFEESTLPRRMRHEVERVFDQAQSPMWLWREMNQILEVFMAPLHLRRRVDRVFDRILSQRGLGMYNQGFGQGWGQGVGGSPFFSSQFRGNNDFNNTPFFSSQFRGNNDFNNTPFFSSQFRGNNDFNTFNTFNNPFQPLQTRGGFGNEDFTPPVELVETQGEYVVRVDLPGVRETDVETHITSNNVLIIRGERRDFGTTRNTGFGQGWNPLTNGNTEYSEQNYGVFTRTVPLPRNIAPTHVQAFFVDGVLEVRIPKFDSINTFNNSFNAFNNFNNTRNRRVSIGRDESHVAVGSSVGNTTWNGDQRPHVS